MQVPDMSKYKVRTRATRNSYLPAILKIIFEAQQERTLLTCRQIFYQLVVRNICRNKQSCYTHVCRLCKENRKNGNIPWDIIVDTSKPIVSGSPYDFEEKEETLSNSKDTYEGALTTLLKSSSNYNLPLWHGQKYHIEIWIEKDSLARVIAPTVEKWNLCLAVGKGYQSITNVYDAACRFSRLEDKVPIILYFGDYDPRGENIPDIIEQDFKDLGYSVQLERIALTSEQIQENNLPPQPCKQSDTMYRKWVEAEGDNVWELDALPSHKLISILTESIEEYFDTEIYEENEKTVKAARAWLKSEIEKYATNEKKPEDYTRGNDYY